MSKAGEFLLSVFLPVADGNTLVSVYRLKVDNTLAWVKAHADEIAAQALADIAGTKTLELRTIKRAMTGLGAWCTVRGENGAKQLFSMLEGVKS